MDIIIIKATFTCCVRFPGVYTLKSFLALFFTHEDKAVLSPAGFHFHRAETHTQFLIPIAIISLH